MVFNSKEYSWRSITVIIAGRPVTGIRGIEYTSAKEKEALYGKGDEPQAIQEGNKSYSGTVTLLQSELEALEAAAGGDVLDVAMNILVSYGNPERGDVIKTDLIRGAEFTSVPKGMNQNDKFMECSLEFVALKIEKNIL